MQAIRTSPTRVRGGLDEQVRGARAPAAMAGSTGKRTLQGAELASKLSFFSTLGPPDEQLLAAASVG